MPDNPGKIDRGTDLFAHIAPGGTVCFYLWHWTEKADETSTCHLTSADSAKQFIREQLRDREAVPGLEHYHLMLYLPGVYWDMDEEHLP